MKVEAVQCDACDHIDIPESGFTIPSSWLLVDIDQGDKRVLNGVMFCSWACLSNVAQNRIPTPPARRKRRTKAEMEADAAAATREVETQ